MDIDYIAEQDLTISEKLALTNQLKYEYDQDFTITMRKCSLCYQMNVLSSKPIFMNRCNTCFFK